MIEAARRNQRIVQAGTQLPSLPVTQAFHEYVQSGNLGRVLMAKVWNVQLRNNIGHKEDEPVPSGIDYDIWTGPVPKLPFNRNRFHGTVNWHWHYGCGDIGNDGVHELDIARRALGVELPDQISGMGQKMYFDDDQQTPDTMNITYHYKDKLLSYEQRLWNPYGLEGCDNGVSVYGDKAVAQFGRFRGHNWSYRVIDDKGVVDPHRGARQFLDRYAARPQLPRLRSEPSEAACGYRGRSLGDVACSFGEHRSPHRPDDPIRCAIRKSRQRSRGRQVGSS